ncbi:hypothetical protein BG004_006220 [Podila humilis]|nr:hypothetical protein BG004_006220 [Podila humilis]
MNSNNNNTNPTSGVNRPVSGNSGNSDTPTTHSKTTAHDLAPAQGLTASSSATTTTATAAASEESLEEEEDIKKTNIDDHHTQPISAVTIDLSFQNENKVQKEEAYHFQPTNNNNDGNTNDEKHHHHNNNDKNSMDEDEDEGIVSDIQPDSPKVQQQHQQQGPISIFSLRPKDESRHRHSHNSDKKSNKDSEKGYCCKDEKIDDDDDEGCLPDDGRCSPFDLGPLCTWAELPAWMRDNPAILTGYRRETFSYRKAIKSLGYLHNESVNIWSHLLGAIAFVVVTPIAYFKVIGVLDTIRWTDIAVFYAFIAGAIICLSMSASFHTFCCHSEDVSGQWNRCDYVGIVFLIVGSFYPAIFYGFYCHKVWQIMYISLISVFGGATIVVVLQPRFRTPQFRWVRSGLFLALGLSALFPVIHEIVLYGFVMAQQAVALNYMFCVGGAYVFGALIYGSRVPECFFPGKFDHFMSSHQIFHICVLIGCAVHFAGISKAMAFWHNTNESCSVSLAQMQLDFIPA